MERGSEQQRDTGKNVPGGRTVSRRREVENEVREVVWGQMKHERILDFVSNLLESDLWGCAGLSRRMA